MQCSRSVPEWVKDIADSVRDLIRQHGMQRFNLMVQQWARERDGIPADSPARNLPLMRCVGYGDTPDGITKTLPEKYAVLAAIYNAICQQSEPVSPWGEWASSPVPEAWDGSAKATWAHQIGFHEMVMQIKDGIYCWQGCDWEHDERREVSHVLGDVRADLAEQVLAKDDGSALSEASADTEKPTKTKPGCAYETSCVEEAKAKGCQAWEVAKERAEDYSKNHPWPGRNDLARRCGCHPSVMDKAVDASNGLQRAKAAQEIQKAKPPRRPQSSNDSAGYMRADEALRQLIEYAPEDRRAELQTPGMLEDLASKTPENLAALVDMAKQDAEQRGKAGGRD